MAVVREGITSGGVKYRIMDDAYAGASREELERRRQYACEAAHRILLDYAKKHPGDAQNKGRSTEEQCDCMS